MPRQKARKKWDEVKDEVLHWAQRKAARKGKEEVERPAVEAKGAEAGRGKKQGGALMSYADED